jgi:hypothetical protein
MVLSGAAAIDGGIGSAAANARAAELVKRARLKRGQKCMQ